MLFGGRKDGALRTLLERNVQDESVLPVARVVRVESAGEDAGAGEGDAVAVGSAAVIIMGVASSSGVNVGAGAGAGAGVGANKAIRSMFSVMIPAENIASLGAGVVFTLVSRMSNEPASGARLIAFSRKLPIFSLVARALSSRTARSARAGEVTRRDAASEPSMIWRTR